MRDLTITVVVLAFLITSWLTLNRWALDVYPPDASEGGRYVVIRWASDPNPARVEQIALFNRLYAEKRVRVVLDPDPGVQKILTQAAAGTGPDVIDIYNYATFLLYVNKGILLEVNNFMREAGLSLNDFWEKRWNALAVERPGVDPHAGEHKRYAIYCTPNNVNVDVLFLNRSLYDAVKRDRDRLGTEMSPLPWNEWTWWDFVFFCQALTRKSDDGRRYETFGSSEVRLENLIYQVGGRFFDEQGKTVLLDSEQNAVACQFLYDLVNTFHVVPSQEDKAATTGGGGWGGQAPLGLFTAGKLGTLTIGRWGLIKVRREARFRVEIYPLPRYVPYGEWERWMSNPKVRADHTLRDGSWGETTPEGRDRGKNGVLGGRVTGVRKGTKHPREAFYFLEYLASPEFNELINKDADAFSSRQELTIEYLSKPDADFPEEDQHRAALLDAITFTHEEEASTYGTAFETIRLRENALTPNLYNGEYAPLDKNAKKVYTFLSRTPDASVITNPTVGTAAVREVAAKMRETMAKAEERVTRPPRSRIPDVVGLIGIGLVGGVAGYFSWRWKRTP